MILDSRYVDAAAMMHACAGTSAPPSPATRRRSHISGWVLRMSSTRARSLAAWPSHLAVVIVDEEDEDEEEEDPALRFRPPPVVRRRLPPPRELILSFYLGVCGVTFVPPPCSSLKFRTDIIDSINML